MKDGIEPVYAQVAFSGRSEHLDIKYIRMNISRQTVFGQIRTYLCDYLVSIITFGKKEILTVIGYRNMYSAVYAVGIFYYVAFAALSEYSL